MKDEADNYNRVAEEYAACARAISTQMERKMNTTTSKAREANVNDGGPAFPCPEDERYYRNDGMSLRDYFAAKAMQGLIEAPRPDDYSDHMVYHLSDGQSFSGGIRGRIAVSAYAMAAAMCEARVLAAREVKSTNTGGV